MKSIKIQNIHISPNRAQLASDAATLFVRLMQNCLEQKGCFNVALSGGSTPGMLYRELVKSYSLEQWNRVNFFWSDERYVPQNSPSSNAGTAIEQFLKPLKVPLENIYAVRTELEPDKAAVLYEKSICDHISLESQIPKFDLILLGLGMDGHTASLFPNTNALKEKSRLVVENRVDVLNMWRITFTFSLINNAENVLFLVSGREKAQTVKKVIKDNFQDLPAAGIDPVKGLTHWYLDQEAASQLGS
ncbi:6-phosphogluconolactonase [candidate division KSB1 bacterium]|nr:6-phosphogluconolactonase [candidate division KSB1 bacterium]